jgi:BTB/POZ domain/Leucine rich repeat
VNNLNFASTAHSSLPTTLPHGMSHCLVFSDCEIFSLFVSLSAIEWILRLASDSDVVNCEMELACRFEDQTWSNEKKYTCIVTSANINEPGTIIKAIRGVHLPSRTDFDVEAIKFEYTTVEYFPRGLRQIYQSLKALQINKCGLTDITVDDMEGLHGLATLFLGYNQLTSLPSDLFRDMKELKCVSFYNNKISRMSSELLAPIVRNPLHYANFRKNTKIDVLYDLPNAYSVTSIGELMYLIDNSCNKPIEDIMKADKLTSNEKFLESFKDLWVTGRLSDFTIVVGTKQFLVHRSVLSVRSSVLNAIFENDMQERRESEMTIVDFSEDAVRDFLHYLYTSEILSELNAMELFALASKYDVPDLRALSEKFILNALDESNALEILTLGNLYHSEEMIENSFDAIKLNPELHLIANLRTRPDSVIEIVEAKRKRDEKIAAANKEFDEIIARIKAEDEETATFASGDEMGVNVPTQSS